MRRKSLLTAAMLSVLLTTSACGSVTGAPSSSEQPSGSTNADIEASSSPKQDKPSSEVSVSRGVDAEKAATEKVEATKKAAEGAGDDARKAGAATGATPKADSQVQAAGPAPVVSPKSAPAPSVAPAAQQPAQQPVQQPAQTTVLPASSSEQIVNTTYTTAYTWHDNTPAGSASVSNPILHGTAGGTGTYNDPVTIAVGHSLATGVDVLDFPAGTRIYLPDVRRYFIVEDTCGDGNDPQGGPCHQGANANGTNSTIWIDMWIGGESMGASGAGNCASTVTAVNTAVFNPASNYAVAPGVGVIHDGKCDAGYGPALLKQ